MRNIDNTLFLEWREGVECGFSENTLKNAKLRNSPSWHFMNDPDDKRRVLIGYEKLNEENKKKVIARFGNPYDFMARQPIRDLVKFDHEAEKFYLDYKYDGSKKLSSEHVEKYTKAASWLNMFKNMVADKKALKKLLNLSIDKFWLHCIELIKIEKIDLPTSYDRLIVREDSALKKYTAGGYASLIDWRFGNKLAAKVKDELSESTLVEMLSHPNQYDDVFISWQYNKWAKANAYKMIDAATVGNWRRKKEHEIIMFREGNAELNEKFIPQVKGFRPTAPLYMVESDDNHLDLLFIDPDDKTPHSPFHKYKAIVVMDSFNDYVLGYAYAERLSTDLVRAAYLSAMYHIRELTGSWILPHESKTDRWAIKELEPFYQSLGKYFKTPVGSKHRGYIEPFFGSPHWKRCLKIRANNYSGNNMTAKYRGVNQEVLQRNAKNRPMIGNEAIQQIENFFHSLRHLPQSNGISKHEQWLNAMNALPANEKRIITDEQFLLKFGIEHTGNGDGTQITNRGIEPQINNRKYSYDLQVQSLMEYVGKRVSVFYDPYDMSRVLVTDHDKVRLMAVDARLNSRALKDSHLDSRTYLNASLNEKRDDVNYIAAKADRRKQVLDSAGIDAETLLQAGVMVKELKQMAEQRILLPINANGEIDYLDQI
jgi:hypothetical protein